jgi:hypothetical protein
MPPHSVVAALKWYCRPISLECCCRIPFSNSVFCLPHCHFKKPRTWDDVLSAVFNLEKSQETGNCSTVYHREGVIKLHLAIGSSSDANDGCFHNVLKEMDLLNVRVHLLLKVYWSIFRLV